MNMFGLAKALAAIALLAASSGSTISAQDTARVIPIVARKFSYSPSEVRLKQGEPVTLVLRTEDVAHGLKSKDLQLDVKVEPGKESKVTLTPGTKGQFTAFCNTFCGSGHFGMKMTFIVE